ncbi:GNAT family N-acetyltransferase [Xanthomonas sp. SHU 199]|uniref:GNAT family N-acetyltransferase n=1 Tax=Xanthomonas sp. SHU 199 TaxID=1591174 RepID=UPI0004783193|nr:GNAT family protein [Xanthomonas sp. SHU 199]
MSETAAAAPWRDLQLHLDGIVLRRWRAEDLDALVRHADDAQVAHGLSRRFPHPYTRADGEAFLGGQVIDLNDPVLAIEIGGEACGGIGLHAAAQPAPERAELGYWLGRAHWGQGRMTRIVAAYLDWAVPALRLQRIEALTLPDNHGSARVLQKNGFVEIGTRRELSLRDGQPRDLRLFARTGAAA